MMVWSCWSLIPGGGPAVPPPSRPGGTFRKPQTPPFPLSGRLRSWGVEGRNHPLPDSCGVCHVRPKRERPSAPLRWGMGRGGGRLDGGGGQRQALRREFHSPRRFARWTGERQGRPLDAWRQREDSCDKKRIRRQIMIDGMQGRNQQSGHHDLPQLQSRVRR